MYEYLELELRVVSNQIYNKLNQLTLEKENLTIHQCWILQHLVTNLNTEVFQKDIERLFSIRRSTANDMLRTMETYGYIKRILAKTDNRKNILIATEKGKEACNHIEKTLSEFTKTLHQEIDEEELRVFRSVLIKLGSNAQ